MNSVECICCNIYHANVAVCLWDKVAMANVFTINQSSHSLLNDDSPLSPGNSFASKDGCHSAYLSFSNTVSCQAISLEPRHHRKLDVKGAEVILLFEPDAEAYHIWNKSKIQIIGTRAVIFNEHIFPCHSLTIPVPPDVEFVIFSDPVEYSIGINMDTSPTSIPNP
ncbi:hypothetical protein CROQUDRAFT_131651 [Cronartium quercuum f. sp. fusiforme G11]|uniref:Retroviral polymerase SH3-like domain-containing protein n=1 Tax=Cronartium quercuum f. sp. fusiforme G11 TaxID=708437 RepID=A0A9P6NMX0_9BASI|nr:hypothetical protein CROQUDRAFT_131651 [Cronartium quercuum f. sp. fusiforme G11]